MLPTVFPIAPFGDSVLNSSLPDNSNSLVFSRKENQIMYELGKNKGKEEEKVNRLLERE